MEWLPGQTDLGNEVLLIRAGQNVGLSPAQFTLGEVGVHLVSIKVGVIGLAVGIVEPQDFLFGQDTGVVCLDGGPVQSGLSVQEQDVPILHVPAHLGAEWRMGMGVGRSAAPLASSPRFQGFTSAWPGCGFCLRFF